MQRTQSSITPARKWPRIALTLGGLAVLGGLVVLISVDASTSGTPDVPEGVETFTPPDPTHTEGLVDYPQDPPVGGPHSANLLPCDVYDLPVSNELAVHALEHGAVWITYSPDLTEADIDTLARHGSRREVIVSPYPGLDSPVVATVWGRQLRVDDADDPRIEQFILSLQNMTAPENGASC